ncbi:hypothetical protein [Desulfovibrio piger]|uniref:hypothetical protein n=1 Tax=Desulfovibrio piger TaxID=901 RepID=UPI0026F313B6|nr:hypothetical protein [Desulfovibrio piger]
MRLTETLNFLQNYEMTSSRCAAMAGREVLLKAFQLYYVLGKPDVPVWAKGTIMGAIGYFILPGGRVRVRFYLQASLGPDGIRRK